MKTLAVLLFFMLAPLVFAQTLPSHDEIFAALYGSHYDSVTKLTTWHCPQDGAAAPDSCMFTGDSTAEINLMQTALMEIDGLWKAFVVASVTGRLPDCHACQPPVAAGVLTFKGGRWQLESRNDGTFRFGAWGEPADVQLVQMGPKIYGFMFTQFDGDQEYFSTSARLLIPDGKTIPEAWHGVLDEDNKGAYDPTDKYGSTQQIHVDAAYRFLANGNTNHHYVLQVISRGYGYGEGDKYGSRDTISNFCFLNGRYRQVNKALQCSEKQESEDILR